MTVLWYYDIFKEGGKERRGLVTQLINMEGLNTMYKVMISIGDGNDDGDDDSVDGVDDISFQ